MRHIVVRCMTVFLAVANPFANASEERDPGASGGKRLLQIEEYFAIADLADPEVSPDGSWVAFTVTSSDLERDDSESRVWMVPLAGGEPIAMTAEGSSASDPRWSPDGRFLSFLSDREEDEVWQLFILDRRGGEARQITEVKQGIEAYEWSPDGKQLVLVIGDPKPGNEGTHDTNQDEAKTPDPWVIDRLQFKHDDEGYLDRRRDHLYVFDLASEELRQITFGDFDDTDPEWSPDGKYISFVSNRTEEPDANYNTDLWLVDPNGTNPGETLVQLTTNPGSDRDPVWHPDSKRLAYITITRPEVIDYAQTDLAVIRVGDEQPTILTRGLDRMVHEPRFSADGESVLFMIEDRGEVQLAKVPPEGGSLDRFLTGNMSVEEGVFAADGTVIALISETDLPAELFAIDPDSRAPDTQLRRLTSINHDLLSGIQFAAVEKVAFPSHDGAEIETFIYKPPNFKQGKRYPTILWIHGGPQGQYDWGWDFDAQLFAANGYVVVMPNPRGSTGYGQEFCLAIWRGWGSVDTQDVLAAVDHAIALGYSDPERLGVGGWSYGGILTNYVITSTERFKAAMSGASGALWVALYGHDHYQHWYEMEFGLPWENRELWESLSPYNRVQHITTPTLWMGGEHDWNVPILTSEIMYQAMRRLGRDTLLVVYPDEDHGIDTPSYVKHMYGQWLAWYNKYLKQ